MAEEVIGIAAGADTIAVERFAEGVVVAGGDDAGSSADLVTGVAGSAGSI